MINFIILNQVLGGFEAILGGDFKYVLFSPLPGEMIQFGQVFFRWVETTN